MFFRASALLLPVVALSSLVAAAPEPVARGGAACSNGVAQCCNTVTEVSLVSARSEHDCSPICLVPIG